MKAAIDVHYHNDDYAVASGVLFSDWQAACSEARISVKIDRIKPYQPGRFFERELPCILALLDAIQPQPELLIIDGFVTLGDEARAGLGTHLYNALGGRIPVIGVAKSSFANSPDSQQVVRGGSQRPLYVTSIGIDHAEAKHLIASMHGQFRVPTLLKLADSECRNGIGELEPQGAAKAESL